jgi:predicted metal-binding membrane protein
MSASTILVAMFRRDRAIVAFGLAGAVTLSWAYLIYMDWGMRHMDVGMEMVIMPAMQNWTAWDLVLVFLMWAVMMVAMMVPAASPVILLFAEINRRRGSWGAFRMGLKRLTSENPLQIGRIAEPGRNSLTINENKGPN